MLTLACLLIAIQLISQDQSAERGSTCNKLITHQYYPVEKKKTFPVQRGSRQEVIDGETPVDDAKSAFIGASGEQKDVSEVG